MKETLREREIERQAEDLRSELRDNTARIAQLINLVPDERALFEAQRRAIAIGVMMMDLSTGEPDYFFKVWPIVEHEIREAQGVCGLLRLRLAQPLVRARIRSELRN